VSERRANLDEYKQELAWTKEAVDSLGLDDNGLSDLLAVVEAYRPTALIGASGQGSSFDENVIRTMARYAARPIVLPMSNPTAISEAVPADVLEWTNGRALVATGSPFGPVELDDRVQPVSQANNVLVFPGIGLGAIACEAVEITDAMIAAAGRALGTSLSNAEIALQRLVPGVTRLREVCGEVALAVAEQAVADGVARQTDDLEARIEALRWRPAYPEVTSTAALD
jgi:malate dehydrogenase (oxaloacetate-decarboxylating)